jgi:hypothetical protein
MRISCLVLFSILFGIIGRPDSGPVPHFLSGEVTYLWPTNASDYMSATFAETRSAHFHSAVDIGTWGREGFDVFASRDGYIYRVGVSPYGYGNVIYMIHEDSTYTVYAHLQDFAPPVRAAVDSIRFTDYRHSFDEILADKALFFRAGEIIGRTGSTGIGPPHLHFEIRSQTNSAVNPKLAGIHIADNVPPVISAVAIEPLSKEALVNRKKEIHTIRTTSSGSQYSFGTIDVSGEIGLAVNASDRSDNGRNVYAVYELELLVDGELYFSSKADSFPMEYGRKMLIDRVYPLLLQRRGGFQRLFVKEGNNLPFYGDTGKNGILNLEPGMYSVKIIARDFYGNETIATGRLNVTEPDPHPEYEIVYFHNPFSLLGTAALRNDLQNNLIWSKNWVASAGATLKNAEIKESGLFGSPVYRYPELGSKHGAAISGEKVTIQAEGFIPVHLYQVLPGKQRVISYPDRNIALRFKESSVFDTIYVNISVNGIGIGKEITVKPETIPLRGFYEIEIQMPEEFRDNPKIGLYMYNERRSVYDYMDSRMVGDVLRARVNRFGTFQIRMDGAAPVLSRPAIWQRSADGQWFASVRAFDLKSGIDFDKVVFKVNGLRGIAEFDPFSDRIRYHMPAFRPVAGENIIEIEVPDRAGNITREVFTVNR